MNYEETIEMLLEEIRETDDAVKQKNKAEAVKSLAEAESKLKEVEIKREDLSLKEREIIQQEESIDLEKAKMAAMSRLEKRKIIADIGKEVAHMGLNYVTFRQEINFEKTGNIHTSKARREALK